LIKRLRDASPGAILATIGVFNFAIRLSHAPVQPVGLASSLAGGLSTTVLVRLVLGVLTSGNVALTIVGSGVGLLEMLLLFRDHVNSTVSEMGFVLLGLLDIFVMLSAWFVVCIVRWAWKGRLGVRVHPIVR
jgi:hypothetical protein